MMIAGRLRRAVLQAAISGQLTEQCTADGDARDLLAAIRAEKARRVRAGELKKERPLPPVTPEEQPFALPANWCWARLGDVSLKIHYGYTASAQKSGNVKLLRITDIQNNHVTWPDVPFCTVAAKGLADYGLHNRDIVIARTGGTIGKSYIVRELAEPAVFASYLIRVIPCEQVNEEYLKLFMESPFYWQQLEAKSQGTGQPNVNGKALSNLVVPLPPFEEQKRIVAFLQPTFNELANLEADERQLEALAAAFPGRLQASLLQAAFSGELTSNWRQRQKADCIQARIPSDIKVVESGKNPVPWGWKIISLLDAFYNLTDSTKKLKKKEYQSCGEMAIVDQSKDFIAGYTNREDLAHKENLPVVVFGDHTRCVKYVDFPFVQGSDGIKVLKPKYFVDCKFFYYGLQSLRLPDLGYRRHFPLFKKELFPIPSLAEQRRIVARLEELLPLCGELGEP